MTQKPVPLQASCLPFYFSKNSPAAISEELLKITEDMQDLAGLRVFDSPFYHTTETLTGTQEKPLPNPPLGGPVPPQDPHNAVSTSDNALENTQGAIGGGGDSSRGSALDQSWSIEPVCPFSPIQHPLHQSLSALEDEVAKFSGLFSPSRPMKNPSLPYEALFDLALPRAASLFVGRRTSEARGRAALERMCQQQEGLEDREEEEGEGMVNASPLEVLDHLVQQGSDTHDKVLKR